MIKYVKTYAWVVFLILMIGSAIHALSFYELGSSNLLETIGFGNFNINAVNLETNGVLSLVLDYDYEVNIVNIDYAVNDCLNTFDEQDITLNPGVSQTFQLESEGEGCNLNSGEELLISVNITYLNDSIVNVESGYLSVKI
jgi:hypothetical protein